MDDTVFSLVKIALGLDPNEALPEENREMSQEEWKAALEVLKAGIG